MNKLTIALCYTRDVDNGLLNAVRDGCRSFGSRSEYLVDALWCPDCVMNRTEVFISRGYDLIVIIGDGSVPHLEYDALGRFNHNMGDSWATCVMTVCSQDWVGPQPTIVVESSRYIGFFRQGVLPSDFLSTLKDHRQTLFDRGLSDREWETIRSYATSVEWGVIEKMRS